MDKHWNDACWIAFGLSDAEWIEVLQDLEDLDFGPDTMALNLQCRPHLAKEKRAFLLDHLNYIC